MEPFALNLASCSSLCLDAMRSFLELGEAVLDETELDEALAVGLFLPDRPCAPSHCRGQTKSQERHQASRSCWVLAWTSVSRLCHLHLYYCD
jgi:hypothetical protein